MFMKTASVKMLWAALSANILFFLVGCGTVTLAKTYDADLYTNTELFIR